MIIDTKGGSVPIGRGLIKRHRRDRGSALTRKSDLGTLKTMLANVSLDTKPKSALVKKTKKKICF